jgi:hypothetical protein
MEANYSQTSFDFSIQDDFSTPCTLNSGALNDNPELRIREVVVDPIRLNDRGDISNSYSADLINNGKSESHSATTNSSTLRHQPYLEDTPIPYARLKPTDLYPLQSSTAESLSFVQK